MSDVCGSVCVCKLPAGGQSRSMRCDVRWGAMSMTEKGEDRGRSGLCDGLRNLLTLVLLPP